MSQVITENDANLEIETLAGTANSPSSQPQTKEACLRKIDVMAKDNGSRDSFLLALIRALAPPKEDVRDFVQAIKDANPGLSDDEYSELIANKLTWVYTHQGAALALPGAIPGLGTLVQVGIETGALTVDLTLMVRNQTFLVFALGELLGMRGRERLVEETLFCLGLWTNALVVTKAGAVRIGTKVFESSFKRRFSSEVLKAFNRKVGTTILTKYGTKRGAVALGRLIPFGIGVAVGGGFNYLTMKAFAAVARKHLSLKAL